MRAGCQHRCFGEALRQPALGIAIGSAGADSHHRRRYARGAQGIQTGCARRLAAIQPDVHTLRIFVDKAGAAQQFQVIEALVARDLAGLGRRNRVGEQPAAPVAPVADAAGNARHPCCQRGVEGIGQQDGAIEILAAQGGGGLAAARAEYHGVDGRFAGVQIGDHGARGDGYMRAWEGFAHGTDGRQRHHGVAQPVGCADQDFGLVSRQTAILARAGLKPATFCFGRKERIVFQRHSG